MRQIKISCNSQLYSVDQWVYILRVKRSQMNKAYNPKGKLHVADKPRTAKTCLSKEVYKQITAASCNGYCNKFSLVSSLLSTVPGRSIKHIPTTIPCLGETKIKRLLLRSSGIFSQTLRNLIWFCSWTMFLALNYWQLTDVVRRRKVSSFQTYDPW